MSILAKYSDVVDLKKGVADITAQYLLDKSVSILSFALLNGILKSKSAIINLLIIKYCE